MVASELMDAASSPLAVRQSARVAWLVVPTRAMFAVTPVLTLKRLPSPT